MIVERSRRQQWRCRANGGGAQPAEHVEDERLASGRRRHRHTRHTPAANGRRPVPRGCRGQDAHRSRFRLQIAGSAGNGNGAEEWLCAQHHRRHFCNACHCHDRHGRYCSCVLVQDVLVDACRLLA